MTYRFRGHSVADAGKVYRTPEEIESWKRRDPITRFGALLSEHGVLGSDEIDEIWKQVTRRRARRRSTRRWAPPSPTPTASTSTSTATRPGASSSRAMQAGAPFGERGEERTWRT